MVDFQGQKLAEKIMNYVIISASVIGFILGFINDDLRYVLYSNIIAFIVVGILIVPNWPFLNKNPITWQKPVEKED